MADYIVTTLDAGPAMREAIGRAYATANEQPYPIPAYFPSGERDPDIAHLTYWYVDPQYSADKTQYAFLVDEFVLTLVGQTIATGYGDVLIPTPVALAPEWFPDSVIG